MSLLEIDLNDEPIDLLHMPKPYFQISKIKEITIGDLHANPIKLLYIFLRYAIFSMSSDTYSNLVALYQNFPNPALNKSNMIKQSQIIQQFKQIINSQISITNTSIFVRFAGDIRADRGKDQRFLDGIFDKLERNNVPYCIVLGNHDEEDSRAWLEGDDKTRLLNEADCSYINLIKALKHGEEKHNEINELYKRCYLDKTILVDITFEEAPISSNESYNFVLFSHGAIDWENIKNLAYQLNQPCLTSNHHEIANTIYTLNQEYQFLKEKGLANCIMQKGSAAYKMIWQREDELFKERGTTLSSLQKLILIHAHDKNNIKYPSFYSIDNNIGKFELENPDKSHEIAIISDFYRIPLPISNLKNDSKHQYPPSVEIEWNKIIRTLQKNIYNLKKEIAHPLYPATTEGLNDRLQFYQKTLLDLRKKSFFPLQVNQKKAAKSALVRVPIKPTKEEYYRMNDKPSLKNIHTPSSNSSVRQPTDFWTRFFNFNSPSNTKKESEKAGCFFGFNFLRK